MLSDADAIGLRVPTPSLRRLIQTPLASDSRGMSKVQRQYSRKPSPEIALRRCLTPTATDNLLAPSMIDKWAGARALADLVNEARRLATPTARDWRSGKASPATLSRNSRPLNEQLYARGIKESRLLLATYLWLMAWPIDYADTAYQSAPSKANSRGGGRRSGTRS